MNTRTTAAVVGAFFVGWLVGSEQAEVNPFPEFIPHFGEMESRVCYLLAEPRESAVVVDQLANIVSYRLR